MPLYEVSHATPLSQGQRDQLAESITAIHSTKFTVPRMFINVIFTDSSNTPTYVGGKQRKSNRIVGRVRRGSSRTQEDFSSLCYEIRAAWAQIVHPETADEGGKLPPQDLELRSVFITGELIAGLKASFRTPSAGDELAWAEENYAAFKERAEAGDEDFADLVAEIQSWPEFEF
ncbi:hypothetical protein CABS01_11064 [Colletotrichum abscissum]|uniref:Tautomerase cis-CaaD-like domain-containing protein n=1 Tax=Colletotrichum abscissum TaxID=1671311 RepID=A0A9Q0B2I0_9PEZI|nr:uncharacterized protein CABS01_11064 [Colletotrichum abscissum]KAI3543239.1 hypothetical protein CABS02_10116 [Colletotrichum abscissum]KAK1496915.1 hypothetical protein CABS01_11064 [Colletotrichum abscissum]